jgi:hypothetical protein
MRESFGTRVFRGVVEKSIVSLLLYLFLIGASAIYALLSKSPESLLVFVGVTGFFTGCIVCQFVARRLTRSFGILVVESARWGSDDHDIDVTAQIQGQIRDNKLRIIKVNNTDMAFKDPHFGVQKKLTVHYSFTGVRHTEVVTELDPKGLKLP